MASMISIYITCSDKAEAEKISRHLLDQRLIASANMFPVSSMYWWEAKLQKGREVAILAKSVRENFEKVRQAVRAIQSYDIPCIVSYEAAADADFADWVSGELRKK